jgi:hypothetical protein
MGLAERRAAMEFEKTTYPGLKKQIDEAAGFPVDIEVRWETLAKDGKYVSSWNRGWPKIYFEPIVEAFKEICVDAMGKDALKQAIKKIIVQNTKSEYSSDWARFAENTLTLDYMFTNVDDVTTRKDILLKTLEKAL